jgi:apolipoprotein N-acyltransferase
LNAAPLPRGAGQRPAGPLVVDLLVVVAAGALHSLTFVYTDAWPLQIAFVALLAWRSGEAAPARAALLGGAFGTAWLAAGTWWMYISMHRYGGLPAWMAALAVLALAVALSLYLAAALALHARLRRGRPVFDALLFAACWLLAELARGVLLTGFPWIASGYAHVDAPLSRLAPWIGVYGIGFVAAGLAGLAGALVSQFHAPGRRLARRSAGTAALAIVALAVLAWLPPAEFTRPTTTLQVSLLQGNVPQEQKFDPGHLPQALQWLADELLATQADLVVAPETAIPLLPEQLAPEYWQALRERFVGAAAALVGLPLGSFEAGYTNSVAGLSRHAQALPGGVYRYDKHHLVPFGEFIPSGFRWFTEMMDIPLGDFARGPLVAPSFAAHGERIAPNICYEDLFGEQLGARFREPAEAPTIFVNVSNIGWFGNTIAIEQHLNISRLRALEFQRPMLRATNTGATAIVDHRGHVTHSIAPYTRGRVDGPVQGRDGLTPYARWVSRWGLWPAFALAAAIVLATMALRLRP